MEVSSTFLPALDTVVDLPRYACKLRMHGSTYEAWAGTELVGLLAGYMNDPNLIESYISNVSVLSQHCNKGIANSLMIQFLSDATEQSFAQVRLEVYNSNIAATNLYKKFGFYLVDCVDSKKQMILWLSKKAPLVSVCCTTFNHEHFIEKALESFLMQKTDFDFEILIHDDASSDRTQELITRFQSKNRFIIKPIFQETNQWSRGRKGQNRLNNFPRATGKYIALCEGDDYWTDPLKLQKQVDFLEKNENFAGSFHRVRVFNENEQSTVLSQDFEKDIFSLKDLSKSVMINTCSFVFKSDILTSPASKILIDYARDFTLFLVAAKNGNIKFHDDIMATYRISGQGIWAGDHSSKKYLDHYMFVKGIVDTIAEGDPEIEKNLRQQQYWALENWISPQLNDIQYNPDVSQQLTQLDKEIIIDLLFRRICIKNYRYEKLLQSRRMKLMNSILSPLRFLKIIR